MANHLQSRCKHTQRFHRACDASAFQQVANCLNPSSNAATPGITAQSATTRPPFGGVHLTQALKLLAGERPRRAIHCSMLKCSLPGDVQQVLPASSAQSEPSTRSRDHPPLTLSVRMLSSKRRSRGRFTSRITPDEPELELPSGKPSVCSTPDPDEHSACARQPKPLNPHTAPSEALPPTPRQPRSPARGTHDPRQDRHENLRPEWEEPIRTSAVHRFSCSTKLPRSRYSCSRAVKRRHPRGDAFAQQLAKPRSLHVNLSRVRSDLVRFSRRSVRASPFQTTTRRSITAGTAQVL